MKHHRERAVALASARGLDAVTADDIAAAANVSVRTFHNYSGSKEEALAVMLDASRAPDSAIGRALLRFARKFDEA